MPIPVAAGLKTWDFGHSLAGIDGSNPAGGMDVCLVECCVLSGREVSGVGPITPKEESCRVSSLNLYLGPLGLSVINLLKPTGYVMHQFNIQQLYVLPTLYLCVLYLYENKQRLVRHLQHKLIGFYNRDEKCLQRGTDWVFK
jgi:hypothetical protein